MRSKLYVQGSFYINGEIQLLNFPIDWLDVLKVDGGNGKHPKGSWAEPEGPTMSFEDNHAAMFRHLHKSEVGYRIDEGTKLDHLLSVAFRALACYTRIKNNIKHSKDK